MKNKTNYGQHTIGELIQMLKKAVEDTPYLNIDSPVLISDYNMSGFKYDFDLLPCFSQKHHTAGLCLFHSLGEVTEEVTPKMPLEEKPVDEESSMMKFIKRMKV